MQTLNRGLRAHRYGAEAIDVLIGLMIDAIQSSDVARAKQLYRAFRDVEDLIRHQTRLDARAEETLPMMAVHQQQTAFVIFPATDFFQTSTDMDDVASLTLREREILSRLSRGCSNKQIARDLDITDATVKVHVKALLRKLRVKNRTQAALWALQQNRRTVEN